MASQRFAALILAGMLVAPLAACGGGDDKGASVGGSADDAAFVSGLCKSASTLSASVEKSFSGPTPAGLGEALVQLLKALVQPMQQFSADFDKLHPPSDLADWHKQTSAQLSAAAKALRDGKYDDSSLQGLSTSPIPDMPEAARQRLESIAAKTGACKQANPFEPSAARGSGAATPALTDAATRTWKGKFGTLAFNSDGSATFEIKNCGTEFPSDAPFGVIDTCQPDTYAGRLKVGSYQYTLSDSSGAGVVLPAYVDKSKRLHVGLGTVSPFGPGQKGTVQLADFGTLTVDGNKCSKKELPSSKESKSIRCTWTKDQGQDVLEFDNDFNGKDHLVILKDEGLAVSPAIFVASFEQQK